jgi:rubrerythrin
MGANIAQIKDQTSTAGVEFMDSAQDTLIVALRSIRDQADSALRRIERSAGRHSLAWKCTACGHTKHFTRPALAEVAAPCPRCGGANFDSV